MDVTAIMTHHARQRSRTRQIRASAIEVALTYGRVRRARGAEFFIMGWREVRLWADHGLDLSRFEGVQVICTLAGRVLTVYRNRKPAAVRGPANRRRSKQKEPYSNGARQIP